MLALIPSRHLISFIVAPAASTFNLDDYAGPLPHGPSDPVMSGLQILMQREIGGWSLYCIIIAMGQVSLHILIRPIDADYAL